jgi:two-component system LytT family sensor kinase
MNYFSVMKPSWYRNRWVTIALHIAFWILFFVLPYLLQPSFQDKGRHREPARAAFNYFNLFKCIFWIGLFYFNIYFLLPRFVYKKKYVLYFLSLLLALVFLSILEISFFSLTERRGHFDAAAFLTFNLFPFLFIVVSGSAYRMYLDKIKEENRANERKAENLRSELSFLRSQISPHFMFNVINNIVSLARKRSDLVEPSLIRLSQLMRYFLYESNAGKVPLEKEVEYLENYIALQQQRFGNTIVINLNIGGINSGYEIEPMLLIPFVENAFKHGVLQNGSLDITLSVKDDLLHFEVANPYNEKATGIKDNTPGIGLANVKRRLDLLYGKHHVLLIRRNDGQFKVTLELKLH